MTLFTHKRNIFFTNRQIQFLDTASKSTVWRLSVLSENRRIVLNLNSFFY